MREVICPAGCCDRLDKVVAMLFPDVSRGEARKLIAAGQVFVDGKPRRIASRVVHPGQRLRLVESQDGQTANPPLQVIFEDHECVAIDKPAGMPSAPTRQGAAGTALEVLREQRVLANLWLVHRLDTGTSGVLLFAKTKRGAARWSEAFREQQVQKTYVAVVEGRIDDDHGSIDLPLASERGKAFVSTKGRPATTTWEVLQRGEDRTLLELQPRTGRMHQIRVHLQAISHPVVGDRLYGGRPAARLMLHACRLALAACGSEPTKTIEAAIPDELRAEFRRQ